MSIITWGYMKKERPQVEITYSLQIESRRDTITSFHWWCKQSCQKQWIEVDGSFFDLLSARKGAKIPAIYLTYNLLLVVKEPVICGWYLNSVWKDLQKKRLNSCPILQILEKWMSEPPPHHMPPRYAWFGVHAEAFYWIGAVCITIDKF